MDNKQTEGLQKACDAAGSQSALAEKLGLASVQVINNWFRRGVPADQVIPIYRETGITPHQLRDDIYPDPWYRPGAFGPHPEEAANASQ